MKLLIVLSIICIVNASPTHNEIGTRIINGNAAHAGQFPWQVAIELNTETGNYFCGGSVLSTQWILTAAQCVHRGRLLTLHLGSNTLSGHDASKLVVTTSNYVEHPNFDPYTLENDIGLIRLHLPITFNEYLQPIQLASDGVEAGVYATVAGWGQISDAVAGEVDELMYTNLVLISNEECKLTYGDNLKENMVCAVGNYNEGICLGDTGGPLVAETISGHVQIAVATFISQQGCETLHPSGFTRIDVYRDWINSVIGI